MANSYENTIMPEKPVEQIKPDAIPVDDKGQPLPDPTESLSNYIAPKGVEELRKAYSEVEVDEDVRNTMEPPQKTGLLRKHRPGKRGYDYYGTPSGSVPNDDNGLKPSPLSELFSEAEALEPDFDLDKIREHVLNQNPAEDSRYQVVETPKLDSSAIKNADGSDKKSGDDLLKKPEVIKDPNAPKFLDLYKESTNTRVIYQSDAQEGENNQPSKTVEEAQKLFAEHSQVTKAKKRISKREEKKAIRAAIKAEKKAAKERRKAEKAARKAAKKAARKGMAAETADVTAPDEIIKLREEKAAEEEKISNAITAPAEEAEGKKEEAAKSAEENRTEKTEAEEQLSRQKEEAELEARRAAQEAEQRLQKEKEALKKQKKETKAAQEEKIQALIKLDEEKAAARKAAKEAKSAREEAERLKAELEAMKEAAAQALAQKEEAEEAARIAREEKEKLDAQMHADAEKPAVEQQEKMNKSAKPQKEAKPQDSDEKEADKNISLSEDKSIIKSVMEKHMNEKKAAEKNNSADPPVKEQSGKKMKKNSSGDVYMNSPTMEVIKRRIAEMEAQLSSNDTK